ncbi:MAG: type II secretion system F family protein [Pseudobdellovibrionaceae bacterium]
MARYAYQAKNKAGLVTQGEIQANTESEAKNRLRVQQLEVVRIVSLVGSQKKGKPKPTGMFAPKINSKDLQVFIRQFATLVNAGISVVDGLKILSEGLRPGPLREAASEIKTTIEGGKKLYEAVGQHGHIFDRLFVNMVRAGEEAGILDTILQRLSSYIEKSEKLKSQVKGALMYPAVIMCVAGLVILGILVGVIPKFQDFYSQNGGELPALTQQVVDLSNALQKNWYIYLGTIGAIYFFAAGLIKDENNRETVDTLALKFPVVGEVLKKSAMARLTRTLSTLLSSGVGIIEALEIVARTSGNMVIEKAVFRIKESVINGKKLGEALKKEPIFPDMVRQMIAIGDESGMTDQMLSKIADFYEDEVETAVKSMTSLIEPIMMVVLGGIIAVLVLAMYLPVFSAGDMMGK